MTLSPCESSPWRSLLSGLIYATIGVVQVSMSAYAMDAQEIAKLAIPSVVTIVMQDQSSNMISQGSGFFVERDKVLTNAHVIKGGTHGYIILGSNNTVVAISQLLSQNGKIDLALLKVNTQAGVPLEIEGTKDLEIGETIYVVGSPLGYLSTFTDGIVSAFRSTVDGRQIQISAPISPGSSGGPILNKSGKVVGVAVSTAGQGQNINFAIPIKYYSLLQTRAQPSAVDAPGSTQLLDKDSNEVQKYLPKRHEWRSIRDWDKEYLQRTVVNFKQECEQGDYNSCFMVSHELRLNGKLPEITQYFKSLCDSGKVPGCYFLGRELRKEGDFKGAVALFEKSCSKDPYACDVLATLAMDKRDFQLAKVFAEMSCKAKSSEGCETLYALYRAVPSLKAYTDTCLSTRPAGDTLETCRRMAFALRLTQNQDPEPLAMEARIRQCSYGDLASCEEVDSKYITENKDPKDLLRIFNMANDINLAKCRRGVINGDVYATELRSNCAYVLPPAISDQLKVHSFYCDKGSLSDCSSEEDIERSIGAPEQAEATKQRADSLMRKLCAAHDLGACDRLVKDLKLLIDCVKDTDGLISSVKGCDSLSASDPLKLSRKEIISYKKTLLKLCREGDESVCLKMSSPTMRPIYSLIPEH